MQQRHRLIADVLFHLQKAGFNLSFRQRLANLLLNLRPPTLYIASLLYIPMVLTGWFFFNAYKGYQYLLLKGKLSNPDLLSIADYSQSGKKKRLYVIDLKQGKVLFNTFVSHGKNSGSEYASDFSNSQHSNKSSIGFMITAESYIGNAGYSLRLDGVEAGINDQVRIRNIVMHGSRFVNYERIYERGTIGNSLGCPAIPLSDHKQVIDKIKGGSCLFIYSDEAHYKRLSAILNADFKWPVLKNVVQPSTTNTTSTTKTEVQAKAAVPVPNNQ